MTVLLVLMLACSLAAIVLGLAGRRRVSSWELVAELIMVFAMLDAHGPGAGLLATPIWATVLVACAMCTAFVHRIRRIPHSPSDARAADLVHPIGMLLGATLLLLAGAPTDGGAGGVATHAHRHAAIDLAVIVLVLLVGYVVVVLAASLRRHRGAERARGVTSLGALLAMGAMVALG